MVVVGDSEYDVEMARAAGARPICIARGREPCRGDVEVVTTLYALIGARG
jgi:phosphoglycolate phosphatase